MYTEQPEAAIPKPTGRPSSFDAVVAANICERISQGQSLAEIANISGMPKQITVFRWLRDIDGFRSLYARAREEQAETLAAEIISIADDAKNDTWIDNNGTVRVNQEVVARSRLRVDARKWVASKLLPRVYGDRMITEVTGANGGPIQIDVAQLSKLSETELEAFEQMFAKMVPGAAPLILGS